METVTITEGTTRYRYSDLPYGIPEEQLLDFHSPYGCSGKRAISTCATTPASTTCVPSCYGSRASTALGSSASRTRAGSHTSASPRAWATRSPSTATASRRARRGGSTTSSTPIERPPRTSRAGGQIYNIGGGPEQTVSIWKEFGPLLERLSGIPPLVTYGDWRPGDQPVYISDIRKAEHANSVGSRRSTSKTASHASGTGSTRTSTCSGPASVRRCDGAPSRDLRAIDQATRPSGPSQATAHAIAPGPSPPRR